MGLESDSLQAGTAVEAALREHEDAVELNFTWTEEDVVEAMPLAFGRNRWIWAYLLAIPAVSFLVLLGLGFGSDPIPALASMFIAMVLYLVYLRHRLLRAGPRREFRREKALRQPLHLVFSEDGLAVQTTDTEGRVSWEAYEQVVETEHLYVLFQSKRVMNLVPKRAFANSADEQRFRGMLRRNVPCRLWSDERRFRDAPDPAETLWV